MVSSEGLLGLKSLILSKKEVLWIGSELETPPSALTSLLPKIKFVSLSSAKKHLPKLPYSVVVLSIPKADQIILDEVFSLLSGHRSVEKILILNEPTDNLSPGVIDVINRLAYLKILVLPQDLSEVEPAIRRALFIVQNDSITKQQRINVKTQNAALETKNTDLQSSLYSSSQNFQNSQTELSEKVERTRALVKFIKDLSGTAVLDDLMFLLRQEVKQYHHVKDPILAFVNSNTDFSLLYFQGSQIVEKSVNGVWSQHLRIRLNDITDSQYLADVFGRPFARLLTIPLQLKRKSSRDALKVTAVLFFEHDLSQDATPDFLEFIEERLQPISIALDRLLLEQDLNEASLLWERTFDGLIDPVVIFDSEGQILRANKSYMQNLKSLPYEQLMSPSIRHNDKIYAMHSYPIVLGDEGRSTNLINHYIDVTIAHKLQNQMIQNEKMAALGQLAGHIAHELNNPLTGIRSLAQILIRQASGEGHLKDDLIEVERAAERCQTIIKNLLEFSSGGISNHQVPTAMNDIVSRTLPLLKTLISRFDVTVQLTEASNMVLVEPHLMQQVVFNIIKNAAQAMGESGQLRISTAVEAAIDDQSPMVCLRVADSGPGIAPDIQEKIFDFFFTTKTSSQGTGIGLSMSKSIVDRFGGRIDLKSEMGKGSEFCIKLPLQAK